MSGSDGKPTNGEHGDLLARVRLAVEARRRAGSPIPPPQALDPAPVESSDFFPWRRPAPHAPAAAPRLFVNDLLELSPPRFVVRVHHALLGRDPSATELARWEGRVSRRVWQRLVAIGSLRLSREGRARGVHLSVRWGPFLRSAVTYARARLGSRRWRA